MIGQSMHKPPDTNATCSTSTNPNKNNNSRPSSTSKNNVQEVEQEVDQVFAIFHHQEEELRNKKNIILHPNSSSANSYATTNSFMTVQTKHTSCTTSTTNNSNSNSTTTTTPTTHPDGPSPKISQTSKSMKSILQRRKKIEIYQRKRLVRKQNSKEMKERSQLKRRQHHPPGKEEDEEKERQTRQKRSTECDSTSTTVKSSLFAGLLQDLDYDDEHVVKDVAATCATSHMNQMNNNSSIHGMNSNATQRIEHPQPQQSKRDEDDSGHQHRHENPKSNSKMNRITTENTMEHQNVASSKHSSCTPRHCNPITTTKVSNPYSKKRQQESQLLSQPSRNNSNDNHHVHNDDVNDPFDAGIDFNEDFYAIMDAAIEARSKSNSSVTQNQPKPQAKCI